MPISDFQSQFSMSKIIRIFPKKISLSSINLGAHLHVCYWHFLTIFIFKALYFLKWSSFFDGIYTSIVYESIWKTLKKIIWQAIVLEHKRRPCKMCDSVRQKLGHTKDLTVLIYIYCVLLCHWRATWSINVFHLLQLDTNQLFVYFFL